MFDNGSKYLEESHEVAKLKENINQLNNRNTTLTNDLNRTHSQLLNSNSECSN